MQSGDKSRVTGGTDQPPQADIPEEQDRNIGMWKCLHSKLFHFKYLLWMYWEMIEYILNIPDTRFSFSYNYTILGSVLVNNHISLRNIIFHLKTHQLKIVWILYLQLILINLANKSRVNIPKYSILITRVYQPTRSASLKAHKHKAFFF